MLSPFEVAAASPLAPSALSTRYLIAWQRFDAENAHDPNAILWEGQELPRELFFAQRLTEWVQRLCPMASEALRLASRCQHLRRWMIPRGDYEATRAGYLRWRSDLKRFHAAQAVALLAGVGYDAETIARVRQLNLKETLGHDPEAQVMEDALCLVTLEYQLGDLARKTGREKLLSILRKTWRKMSPAAHREALALPYEPELAALLHEALA